MDQTVIGFPQSLTEFRSSYPLTRKNIEDITQQCPNLTVLVINPSYFDDSIMSLVLSNVSQKIEKFSLFARDTLSNITGSYFSVFSSNSFSHLKKLKVVWKSTSDETILNLQKNLSILSRTLERLNVVFTNEYDPSYELDTLLVNCKLEEVLGEAIEASVIPHLPRSSLKVLNVRVTNENVEYLKYLGEFKNLTTLKVCFGEQVTNLQECTFPSNITNLSFVGEITGAEIGFKDWLLSTKILKELVFSRCKIQDEFIKDIIPLSDELDILKIEYNDGLTQESTQYFRQFTNCRVLLLECFDSRVLSADYSLFEQEVNRVTVIMKEEPLSTKRIYPTIDYNDIDQCLSYVRERIYLREMKDACLAIEQLSSYVFLDISKAEICKLFLTAFQDETSVDFYGIFDLLDMISRVLHQFIDGKQEICNFSGHVIINTVIAVVDHFPQNDSILDFINLVMSNEFFKSSKKTLELIAEKKAKIDTEFTETKIKPILKPIGEDLFQFVQENIPPQKKDYTIHIADVKVPKTGPFNTSYYSEPFIQFGHEWVVELLPDDEDECLGNSTVFLTLNSTIPVENKQQVFDRIRLDFFICNFDLEPQSYLVHSRKFIMPKASYGIFLDKTHIAAYSTDDDDFLKFKFVVGMKKVEEEPFKPFNNIEMFHVGRKESSSTNYPPIVHRWATEFPLSIHTLTFRVSPDNIDRCCYSDKFTAFGAKFSACFNHLGVANKVKDFRENSSLYLYLCSFDYNDKENELESIKVKAIFANSDFHTESFFVFKNTFHSLASSGRNAVQRAYYQPKLIHVDGKPYFEYVVNCCLALMSRKTCHPFGYNREEAEEE
ncbi:predicted protein [Naegleria gruberi]|uniref:Predicted protein n=1 Tax=Naegleria gruberi TaxID=5762 RepID=D2W181_NAEGR|nr:uncharacterized protein NAEGRDRAFT_75123 [Naegleria gruberi]EFC37183.1 predicted protein [Naegleria gruberi]|eukprot:XP_002669927.1 predicted protein [Naegleria gruberi strain NEG-M]